MKLSNASKSQVGTNQSLSFIKQNKVVSKEFSSTSNSPSISVTLEVTYAVAMGADTISSSLKNPSQNIVDITKKPPGDSLGT